MIKLTIKLAVLLLASTFISCGDSDEEYEEYKLIEHYEKKVVIDNLTTSDDINGYYDHKKTSIILLGDIVFSGRNRNNVILDTLVIDLTNFKDEKRILIFHRHDIHPNPIDYKYATINHFEIIGINDRNDFTIVFDEAFDKVKINSSNISIEELNKHSQLEKGDKFYNHFEKVELEKQEVSFTFSEYSTPKYPSMYGNFINKEIGYIDYGDATNRGAKFELISRSKF